MAMDRAEYEALIPVEVSRDVMQSVGEEQSAVAQLARRIPMPTGLNSVPVVSVAPDAAFVNNPFGGRKPIGTIEWSSQRIVAEEIACTLAIPNAFIDDSGFPVWESVRPELAKSFAREFDRAALYGTGAPASYPTGGLTSANYAEQMVPVADPIDALDDAFAAVEDNGTEVDGILGGPGLRGVMRSLMLGTENVATPPGAIWGVPFETTPVWDKAVGAALVGGWEFVVVGIREDVRFELSTEGVLTDPAGVVLVNAFQDDSTLMRAYMRIGIAVGRPLGPDGNTLLTPLALAKTTAPLGLAQREAAAEAGAEPRRKRGGRS
jgi:Phage capsid family